MDDVTNTEFLIKRVHWRTPYGQERTSVCKFFSMSGDLLILQLDQVEVCTVDRSYPVRVETERRVNLNGRLVGDKLARNKGESFS